MLFGNDRQDVVHEDLAREIPFVKIGRSVRFDVRDLEALIERSRVRAEEF
jgi:hypothetical protein